MHRHLRGLLVAAAATLASASQPFSWADAQASMHACTNESRPLVDKYAYLSTRHAVGNALNGWMHVFMYALASGRQPVVGSGVAPRLFCGREGAFSCGVPFVNDARTLGGVRKMVGRHAAPFSDRTTAVLASDANQGYQWHGVGWLQRSTQRLARPQAVFVGLLTPVLILPYSLLLSVLS